MTSLRALVAGLALATVTLTACGGGDSDPLGAASPAASGSASSAPVVVGSAAFTESEVLAELYAGALEAKGIPVSTRLGIGSREVYLPALQDGSISLVPEYTGNLLLNFDADATATTAEEVEAALPGALPAGLQVLKSSPAVDQDVYVVTKEFSEANGVTSLEDLRKVAGSAVLGGPSELEERTYGPEGLKQIYGAEVKQFKPYDATPVRARDLNDGKIQVATFFTTESVIAENGFVPLADPQSMILPQNVVPLVRSDVAGNQTAVAAIEAVQAALTTEELTALNARVDNDRQEPDEVAAEWLQGKGLG